MIYRTSITDVGLVEIQKINFDKMCYTSILRYTLYIYIILIIHCVCKPDLTDIKTL